MVEFTAGTIYNLEIAVGDVAFRVVLEGGY